MKAGSCLHLIIIISLIAKPVVQIFCIVVRSLFALGGGYLLIIFVFFVMKGTTLKICPILVIMGRLSRIFLDVETFSIVSEVIKVILVIVNMLLDPVAPVAFYCR
ncbi:hypothetical protein AU210_013602 [Fusarium oxysporum f. sp. radicis-cucumerinum]|uniref:Uncharacterized protein n=1 Tax=Fusarium oxysporum f. sp. radicis-cucumerinum TaxID=327505 RepID=A0A2H3GIF7_FUSOX|nr:hypothetical protein AU210_013602 [Fusarium oxysporum f. sp. radicis-cucumerinum]